MSKVFASNYEPAIRRMTVSGIGNSNGLFDQTAKYQSRRLGASNRVCRLYSAIDRYGAPKQKMRVLSKSLPVNPAEVLSLSLKYNVLLQDLTPSLFCRFSLNAASGNVYDPNRLELTIVLEL